MYSRVRDEKDSDAGESALAALSELRDIHIARLILGGLEACQTPVVLYRPDDTIAYMSASFRDILDVQPGARSFGDVIRHCYKAGKGTVMSMPPDEWLAMAAGKRRALPHRTFEVDFVDGRWFMVSETCLEDGWLWTVFTDISGLKTKEMTLQDARDSAQREAETDALTGVSNRRHGLAELEKQLAAFRAFRKPMSIALVDLDRFKFINDTHGHLAGDAVLCDFASCAQKHIRDSDTIARYGGEEFLVVMPGADAAVALAVLDRIRTQVANGISAGASVDYTFSAGIACCIEVDDVPSLLKRADVALYRAKKQGRDRIEVAAG